jgi:hypothetical protein
LLSNFCVKIFSQNSLIPIQILNGFLIFYCATWGSFLFLNKNVTMDKNKFYRIPSCKRR